MARPQRLIDTVMAEKERAFVEMPMEWPRWPLLPMKRRRGQFADADYLGFLFADGKPTVYIGGIFELKSADPKPATWKEALAKLQTIEYPDFDAMLEVWMVD